VFPFVSGSDAEVVYRAALQQVGEFLPFHSLVNRAQCGRLLAEKLCALGLVDDKTRRLDPLKFQAFVTERKPADNIAGVTNVSAEEFLEALRRSDGDIEEVADEG